MKFTITGNLIALEQAYKDAWLSASELMLIRGLQVKTYHHKSKEMLETKTWNILHFALHFRHIHIVKYLLETVKINLSMMLEEPRTIDEVEVKSKF